MMMIIIIMIIIIIKTVSVHFNVTYLVSNEHGQNGKETAHMCKVIQARMAPRSAWGEVPNVYIVGQTTKPTF